MVEPIDVLIVGGGISGLTLANLLIHANTKQNFRVKIFESRTFEDSQKASIGGGIGLWPPSQEILSNIPNYHQFIDRTAFPMPSPSYRDSNGQALAKANKDFSNKFPVLSLNRDDLINWLLENLNNRDDVEFIHSQKINDYERDRDKVTLKTEDGIEYQGDLLVACDGIHSKVRNCLMTELDRPQIKEKNLGYTYFRANTNIPANSAHKWWSAAVETWGSHQSEEHGNHEIRFGYVPLKPPSVFWFIAVKTKPDHQHLAPINGVEVASEETKQFLTQLVKSWAPITNDEGEKVFDYAELIQLTPEILRTDIAKIEDVEKFPWTSEDKRIILLGDSAHATAPNIAQGAGLCIEDAACLASKLERVDFLNGLSGYEQERKQRAKTVQTMADLIATVGQTENSFTKMLRNGFMRTATQYLPSLQQSIFNYVVSHSLGGSSESAYWSQTPLFNKVFPDNESLNEKVRDFKTSPTGGSGSGVISVENPGLIAQILTPILGLPKAMTEQPFAAEVTNLTPNKQQWTRVFASKTPNQKTYSTTHSSFCDSNRQTYLSEGVGGYFDRAFRFIYTINQQQDYSLRYESQGLTFFDLFKVPLPSFLLPKSEWVENPTDAGWSFDGTISLPLIGNVMHYHGHFNIDKKNEQKNQRAIIAGGSGMIGTEVCLEFIRKGYDVYCLSRSSKTQVDIDGVKMREINGDWSDLIDNNTIIINLSGSNPGRSRWTAKIKNEIAESRYQTIDTIIKNIEKSPKKPLKFLQASAAGYYGNAGDLELTEASKPIAGDKPGTQFRIEVCQEIEKRAAQASCNVVNLRIGHVLSNKGGLLPYYRLSGFFNAGRFGSGNQYVPFIHIKDVAKAIEFIADNDDIPQGAVNLTAPTPCSNSDMLKELRLANWIPGIPLPESVLKLLIGESAVILTDSERVLPEKLLDSGYEFEYPTIEDSLNGLK